MLVFRHSYFNKWLGLNQSPLNERDAQLSLSLVLKEFKPSHFSFEAFAMRFVWNTCCGITEEMWFLLEFLICNSLEIKKKWHHINSAWCISQIEWLVDKWTWVLVWILHPTQQFLCALCWIFDSMWSGPNINLYQTLTGKYLIPYTKAVCKCFGE